MFDILKKAESEEDIQAGIFNINSTIMHEYMEYITDDKEKNIGNGDFGAYNAQSKIFGLFTTSLIFDGINREMTTTKAALGQMKKDGKPESLTPEIKD